MSEWIYKNKVVRSISEMPDNTIGFVYIIFDLTNNRSYIGRKNILSRRKRNFGKREIAELKDKRLKTYEIVVKEMKGWKEYTGSSANLNDSISKGATIRKEIIRYCKSKQELTYFETKEQFIHGVIEPGNNSYNENVLGKFFPKIFRNDKGTI